MEARLLEHPLASRHMFGHRNPNPHRHDTEVHDDSHGRQGRTPPGRKRGRGERAARFVGRQPPLFFAPQCAMVRGFQSPSNAPSSPRACAKSASTIRLRFAQPPRVGLRDELYQMTDRTGLGARWHWSRHFSKLPRPAAGRNGRHGVGSARPPQPLRGSVTISDYVATLRPGTRTIPDGTLGTDTRRMRAHRLRPSRRKRCANPLQRGRRRDGQRGCTGPWRRKRRRIGRRRNGADGRKRERCDHRGGNRWRGGCERR